MKKIFVLCAVLLLTSLGNSLALGGGRGSGGGGGSTPTPRTFNPYPDRGTMHYSPPRTGGGNARNTRSSQHLIALEMNFDNPGDWYTGPARGDGRSHSGIMEIDFWEKRGNRYQTSSRNTYPFFTPRCTSWSTLPEPYDDCPTSGVSEPKGQISHGIGSWKASSVSKSRTYWGYIYIDPWPSSDRSLIRRDGDNWDWSLNWSRQEHALPGNPRIAPTDKGTTYCYYRSTERNIWCVQTLSSGIRSGGYLKDSVRESSTRPLRYNRSSRVSWNY